MSRICLITLCILSASCVSKEPTTAELFERYTAASKAHDLVTLEAMTHEDIVWRLGPWTWKGKDEALRPHEVDHNLNARLDFSEVIVRGDTVEFKLTERNDATRAYGPDSVVHYGRFVFEDGKVKLKEATRPAINLRELLERGEPYRQWVRDVHPEALKVILDSTGQVRWGGESSRIQAKLLQEWVAARKPGALED